MKKILILFSFIMAFSKIEGQVSIRPFVGINSATLTKTFDDVAWQSALGYQAGLDLMFGSRMYFQPGLHWELIRQDFTPTNPIPGFDTKFQASHIRVPLMIGFKTFGKDSGGLINFRLYTGPDIAFSVSNSEHAFLGINLNSDTYNNLHWSWNGGLGFDILFLFLDVGYKFGLSDYFEGSVNNGSRTNVFFANAGIRFDF